MKVHVIVATIFLSACTHSSQDTKDDVRAVVSGILEADIERVLSYYHDEAVLFPPGKDEIRGLESIRRNYENIFATSVLNLSPEEDEVTVTNDVAVYTGRTKGQIIVKSDSSTRTINEKFLMILKKDDGRWKISTLIWN
jgi:ketosteroid isomerase-like protein